jgi:hypothetical protein
MMDSVRDMANFDCCGGTRLNLHVSFLPPAYPIYGVAENGK